MVFYRLLTSLILVVLIGCQSTSHENNYESVEVKKEINQRAEDLSQFDGWPQMQSLSMAYEDISEVEYFDGDLSFVVKDKRFYWAHGRLLTQADTNNWEDFAPYSFYPYPKVLPPIQALSEEHKKDIERQLNENRLNPPNRNESFYEALWGIKDQESAWEKQKTIYFLGHKTTLHRELLEDLSRVEERIHESAKKDRELRSFLKTFYRVDAYNWRNIASTTSRSLHAYGLALDLIASGQVFQNSYWQWVGYARKDWYNLPYNKRFNPPQSFIQAFEAEGFIWGGKWFFYDSMHFEYRPEILILQKDFQF